MTNPQLITTPFAENGTKNTIPESGSAEPQLATMQAGFPEITQRPISDGGIPPDRADFNGILNMYGQHIVHLNKGLAYEFDQDFADKIGGYPLNARIMLSNGEVVQNTQEGNTNNPNISMGGWKSSAVSKDVTVPTYKTVSDGVNSVTGVADGAYFNVRSEDDDTVAVEYQNVGGSAVATGRSYLSALGVKRKVNETLAAQNLGKFNIKDFGAVGDGITNDHEAFRACAAAVEANGGGCIIIPEGEYLVGRSEFIPGVGFGQTNVFDINGSRVSGGVSTIHVVANNVKMKLIDGIRFGTFDLTTGLRKDVTLPYSGPDGISSGNFFQIFNVDSVIFTGNLELDGNCVNYVLGGNYGDTGRQLNSYGIRTRNINNCYIENLYVHHMGLDGVYLSSVFRADTAETLAENYVRMLSNVISEYNGRQALTISGGSNYTILGGSLSHTGQANIQTQPMSGCDIETEWGNVKYVSFFGTKFINNRNSGIVADMTDATHVKAHSCTFISSSDLVYITRPYFEFHDCIMSGPLTNLYKDNIGGSTKFFNCLFTDDADVNPYTSEINREWMYNQGVNPVFKDCTFSLGGTAKYFYSTTADFENCRIIFRDGYSPNVYYGWGRYSGEMKNVKFFDLRNAATNRPQIIVTGVCRDVTLHTNNTYTTTQGIFTTPKLFDDGAISGYASNFNLVDTQTNYPSVLKIQTEAYNQAVNLTFSIFASSFNTDLYPSTTILQGMGVRIGDVVFNTSSSVNAIMGRAITNGFVSAVQWRPLVYLSAGYKYYGDNVYQQISDVANSGEVPPTHTTGTVNGFTYLGKRATFEIYGAKGVSVENAIGVDDTATKLNALISSLKGAGYIQ